METTNTYKVDFMPSEQIAELETNAKHQETRVLRYLKGKDEPLGASRIWLAVRKNPFEPLTSIRRALTNLQTKGKVVQHEDTEIGFYKRPEHLWSAK